MSNPVRALGSVLVTGASGFVGAALVDRLRSDGAEVTTSDIVEDEAIDFVCDVTDFGQVSSLLGNRPFDTVFHCGAVSGPMVMADRPLEIWRINATGTANILEAARNTKTGRVLVCSTSEVYGDLDGTVDETVLPKPNSVYAASKLAAEQVAQAYAAEHAVDVVILRLSWIYGPGRRTPTMLEAMLKSANGRMPAQFDAHPDDMTHYLYIDDAISGLLGAAEAAELHDVVFNISAGSGVPMSRIIEMIAELRPGSELTLNGMRSHVPCPIGINADRANDAFGFRPKVSLRDGLEATLQSLIK